MAIILIILVKKNHRNWLSILGCEQSESSVTFLCHPVDFGYRTFSFFGCIIPISFSYFGWFHFLDCYNRLREFIPDALCALLVDFLLVLSFSMFSFSFTYAKHSSLYQTSFRSCLL